MAGNAELWGAISGGVAGALCASVTGGGSLGGIAAGAIGGALVSSAVSGEVGGVEGVVMGTVAGAATGGVIGFAGPLIDMAVDAALPVVSTNPALQDAIIFTAPAAFEQTHKALKGAVRKAIDGGNLPKLLPNM